MLWFYVVCHCLVTWYVTVSMNLSNYTLTGSCLKCSKKQQSIGIKFFYSNISYGFEYKKNYIRKPFVKIFIKRNTRARKTYVYWMLLIFKTSVTFFKKKKIHWLTVSVVKEFSSDITQIFVRHSLMPGTIIQAWNECLNIALV